MKQCAKCSFGRLVTENEGDLNEKYHIYCTAAQRHCGQVTFYRNNVSFLFAPDWCPRDKMEDRVLLQKQPQRHVEPLVLPIVY